MNGREFIITYRTHYQYTVWIQEVSMKAMSGDVPIAGGRVVQYTAIVFGGREPHTSTWSTEPTPEPFDALTNALRSITVNVDTQIDTTEITPT